MNNFAEGMAAWLIGCFVFLIWSFKRHWKIWLAAYVAFLIYRHLTGAN
jgi:hypothetical protein